MKTSFKFTTIFIMLFMLVSSIGVQKVWADPDSEPAPEGSYITFSSDSAFTVALTGKDGKLYNDEMIQYSTDLIDWEEYKTVDQAIPSNSEHKLYFRGLGNSRLSDGTDGYSTFVLNGTDISCTGNIETLLNYKDVIENKHPAMASYALAGLFEGCAALIEAPTLPSTTLADHCYHSMFKDCTSLTTAPDLPATTMADGCYMKMFMGCTSLTAAPGLASSALDKHCYSEMFSGCTSLASAPDLPATTMAEGCYLGMFENCTSLTATPELPAEELAQECYFVMFGGCTSLTEIPDLPATTLANGCYSKMFSGCTSLKVSETLGDGYSIPYRVPSSGTGTEGNNSLFNMFSGTGGSFKGTPLINTTYYLYNQTPAPEGSYITFSSDSAFTVALTGKDGKLYNDEMIQYSTDLIDWEEYKTVDQAIPSNSEHKLYFRGLGNSRLSDGTDGYSTFVLNGTDISCTGNIETLLNYKDVIENKHPAMASYALAGLFEGCAALIEAPTLPSTTLADHCYHSMFKDCTSLTTAPDLPATTMADGCYMKMFMGCTSLTAAPGLASSALDKHCYSEMFSGCTSLASAPDLPATTMAEGCYLGMFENCTSLTATPELPAEELAQECYFVMFGGCTSLTEIPDLPATTLANGCYSKMFSGCTSLKVSETLGDGYSIPYRVPSSGTGTEGNNSLFNMFSGTGGSFKGTPLINTTYYLYNQTPAPEGSYITFSSDSSFKISLSAFDQNESPIDHLLWNGEIQYSTNLITWKKYDTLNQMILSNSENKLYFRGINNTRLSNSFEAYSNFVLDGTDISCTGNIETLLDYQTVIEGNEPAMGESAFFGLFKGCTALIEAPDLPAMTLAIDCYHSMFKDCTSLTSAPKLPATTLTETCYMKMFMGCASLTDIPILSATDLKGACYSQMFDGCVSLKVSETLGNGYNILYRIPKSGTGTADMYSLYNMFSNTGGTFVGEPEINTIYYLYGSVALSDSQKPKARENLTYSKEGTELITAPEVLPEGYVGVQYSIDGGKTFSNAIPKGNGGDYAVLTKYIGDDKHKDCVCDEPLIVTIQNKYYGGGSSWVKRSDIGIIIIFKAFAQDHQTFSKFIGIKIDNSILYLDISLYHATRGSVNVTLNPSYLETLSVGEHTVTAYFSDGATATANFVIKERTKPTTPSYVAPKTGN